jgi:hypothetical protein
VTCYEHQIAGGQTQHDASLEECSQLQSSMIDDLAIHEVNQLDSQLFRPSTVSLCKAVLSKNWI